MNASPLIHTVGGASFGKCNVESQRLFSVNAGVSGEEALQHASLILNCVNTLSFLGHGRWQRNAAMGLALSQRDGEGVD